MIKTLRKRILEVALRDGMGHIPSALSILDIVWVLHDKVMTPDDQFILSKGHGCMALYAVLEQKGLLEWNSKLWGHPKRGGAILASTGSLGHGMPMAMGLAMAKKIKGEKGRVFCIIGDGEANEGTIWETAQLAAHHHLDNFIVICDDNDSSDRALNVGKLDDKFHAFGWSTWNIYGHKESEIIQSCDMNVLSHYKKPLFINAQTMKGHGVLEFENKPEWHNKCITKEIYEKYAE